MRHPKESYNKNPSSGQKSASSAAASNVSPSTSQEPRPIVGDELDIANGSAMAPAPQPSTSGARAANEQSPGYDPDFMYVEQLPSNWSVMSPAPQPSTSGAHAHSVYSPGYEPDFMNLEQPFSNTSAMSSEPQPSTSGAHAASVYSPGYEPDFMYVEQPPSNRSELSLAEQPSTSRGPYAGSAGYRSAMAPAPQPSARGARAANVPRVEIIEQPARYRRFRYPSEVDSAGSIRGQHYTEEHRTYPTIRILGFRGRLIIIVCTLTKDSPGAYKVHPACLVGDSDNFKYHILKEEVDVTEDNCVFEFNNLRIQYVSSKNVDQELQLRKTLRIDPFRQGYGHKRLSKEDLHAVRLCFHVFEKGASRELAPPVVSDIIYDSKFTGDLTIRDFCYHSGPTTGGTKIIFVSKQVSKEDIEVFFYEMENGVIVWEAPATEIRVYDRTAISCLSPPYRDRIINNDVQVFYHLRRPSHNSTGSPARFTYRAEQDDEEVVRAKKRKSLLPIVREYIDWQPPVTPPQDYAMQFDQNGEPLPGPSRPRTVHSDASASYTGAPVLNRVNSVRTNFEQLSVHPEQPESHHGQPGSQFALTGMQNLQPNLPLPSINENNEAADDNNQESLNFEQLHVHPEQPESHHGQPGSQFALTGMQNLQPSLPLPSINENDRAADCINQESLSPTYGNQNDENDTDDEFDLDDIYLNGCFD